MISPLRRFALVLASLLLAGSLGGCASINEKAASAFGDYVPAWAGGLPADAPPRPGTAKYDAWMQERERLRALPADQRGQQTDATGSSSASQPAAAASSGSTATGLAPVH